MEYICGPLPVTYTNEDETVQQWLEDNVYMTGVGRQEEEEEETYRFVGFDVEVREMKFVLFVC